MGVMGTFSFQATKTITTGEGGMVVTESEELCDKMCLFRSHGMLRRRYWHEVAGHNFRLTNIQAALGCAQLQNIDQIICERRRVHTAYQRHLINIGGVIMQDFRPEVNPVLWAFAVRLDPEAYPQGRDVVIDQLKLEHIETRPGFYAASLMGHLYVSPRLPICEDLSREVISLPTFPTLQDDQIEFICAKLKGLRK
jgi:perosamine synthetase